MTGEFFKNFDQNSGQNAADFGILMEVFNNLDQNTGGKLQWQIHQMILEFLKHFDQNSVRNYCCLFFLSEFQSEKDCFEEQTPVIVPQFNYVT